MVSKAAAPTHLEKPLQLAMLAAITQQAIPLPLALVAIIIIYIYFADNVDITGSLMALKFKAARAKSATLLCFFIQATLVELCRLGRKLRRCDSILKNKPKSTLQCYVEWI
jgi:hypothetical protein